MFLFRSDYSRGERVGRGLLDDDVWKHLVRANVALPQQDPVSWRTVSSLCPLFNRFSTRSNAPKCKAEQATELLRPWQGGGYRGQRRVEDRSESARLRFPTCTRAFAANAS